MLESNDITEEELRDPKTNKQKRNRNATMGLYHNPFFRFVCICAQFLPLYFICRIFFFFPFSFPFFDILRIGTRDNMYKISDCHLSFVSAAVTIECVLCFEIVEIKSVACCQLSRCMLNILVSSLIETSVKRTRHHTQ